MLQNVSFSFDNPADWSPSPVKAIKFNGDIEKFLSNEQNVADLDAVLTGKAIIVRLNPKAM